MGTLIFTCKKKFKTQGFQITEDFEEIKANMQIVKNKFPELEVADISIFLLLMAPGEDFGGISFEVPIVGHKKASIEIKEDFDQVGFQVELRGEFKVKIRDGVKNAVEKGSKLKLAGVAYRGGAYRGFLSYVKEQNKENQKNWSEIKKYKII